MINRVLAVCGTERGRVSEVYEARYTLWREHRCKHDLDGDFWMTPLPVGA